MHWRLSAGTDEIQQYPELMALTGPSGFQYEAHTSDAKNADQFNAHSTEIQQKQQQGVRLA